MSLLPIVEHHRADPPLALVRRVEQLAAEVLREHTELAVPDELRRLVPHELIEAPAVCLDDLSDIALPDVFWDIKFYQDRARLRAGDGDVVVTTASEQIEFDQYCRDYLGLGRPEWLHATPSEAGKPLALACWEDRDVRRQLVQLLRQHERCYLHPHMGSLAVWQLAALLGKTSRRTLHVIAPHPELTTWVNDKVVFTDIVTRVFGSRFVPRTEHAANFSQLTRIVHELAESPGSIVFKLPDSAGGGGNLVLDSARFRRRSVLEVHDELKQLLGALPWEGERNLLVGRWEEQVISAPSSQLWIPPAAQGTPIVEGLFEQQIQGAIGEFVGSRPAWLPEPLARRIVDDSWLLARLFQLLGYVGRCSFDMLLVGQDFDNARLEFLECNGRWGGTSIPMTLMNRLFGDSARQPYAEQVCRVSGLEQLSFGELLGLLADELYDVRTGRGRIILYNPGRLATRSAINVLALGKTWEEAARTVDTGFAQLVAQRLRRT